jgi:hypothetical protein
MQKLSQLKITILSIISLVMAVYLVLFAPTSIDKSQNIVIKKLSGLSGLVEKDGLIRINAGNKLIGLAQETNQSEVIKDLAFIGNSLSATAAKELKHPKLKGPGAMLNKASTAILAEVKLLERGQPVNQEFLKAKGAGIAGGGQKMVKKSARLIKMVSLRMYITSYWRGLEVIGGLFLLLVIFALRREEKWALPAMLTILALAPIGGLYISLAGLVFFGESAGFIPFGVSLIAFWATLYISNDSAKDKIVYLTVLTILGIMGTQLFAFAEHGIRGILEFPYGATATDPAQSILRFGGPVALYSLIATLVAIYKLSAQQSAGWWYAVQASMGMMVVGFPIHFARTKDSLMIGDLALSTYLVGAIVGLILFVVLMLPYFKDRLLTSK